MTEPEPLIQIDSTYVRAGARKLSYFSGCDYFRLATHPQIVAAASKAVELDGLNVAASRLTTGNHPVYVQLEKRLRQFFRAEDALLVPTGYLTNLVVAQALAGQFSHVLLDSQSHPALEDAARFLDCPVVKFEHANAKDLAQAVDRCGPGSRLILLSDGMFSRNGAAAPLDQYLKVLPRDAWLLVDDAHGAGVLGGTGRGTLEHCGVSRRRVVQTLTLSKAFGAYGGVILGTRGLRRRILDRSHIIVGSTPLPPPLARAACRSIDLLKRDARFRQRLQANAAYVKNTLRAAGWDLPDTPGPIVMLAPRDRSAARKLNSTLLRAGIFPPFLRYPGGPPAGYFRFVISSEHTRRQLDTLVDVLAEFPS